MFFLLSQAHSSEIQRSASSLQFIIQWDSAVQSMYLGYYIALERIVCTLSSGYRIRVSKSL
jgi:hypothetical protein